MSAFKHSAVSFGMPDMPPPDVGSTIGPISLHNALGSGLKAAGHEVRIAAQGHFEGFVRARGLEFSSISGDPFRLVAGLLEEGSNPLAFARRFRRLLEPLMEQNLEEYLGACRDAKASYLHASGILRLLCRPSAWGAPGRSHPSPPVQPHGPLPQLHGCSGQGGPEKS